MPGWTPLAALLVAIALAPWPWHLRLVAAAVQQAAGDARQPVTGSILLVAVGHAIHRAALLRADRPRVKPQLDQAVGEICETVADIVERSILRRNIR